jgi:hypothetical protein
MQPSPCLFFLFLCAGSLSARPAITVYNHNFGVVRDTVPLELESGINEVRYTGVTTQLEPESVVLRDATGAIPFSVLEQSYRGDPLDEPRLLELYEGKTISFLKQVGDKEGGCRWQDFACAAPHKRSSASAKVALPFRIPRPDY